MRTLACVNQKGGSGKTTTAVNLAAALGERGRRVLLIDLDPQASATTWMGITDAGRGLFDVFVNNTANTANSANSAKGNLYDVIRPTNAAGVDIAPASAWMVGIEKALAGEVGAETIFRAKLAGLAPEWDYVLIDCAPSLGILTVSALAAVREILVPVEAHVMALTGLAQLLQTVTVVKERLNPTLEIAGIVACRVDARTRHALEIVEQLRARFGATVYQTEIRENVRLAECPSFGRPITQYDSQSAGARDYRALAAEVDARGEIKAPIEGKRTSPKSPRKPVSKPARKIKAPPRPALKSVAPPLIPATKNRKTSAFAKIPPKA